MPPSPVQSKVIKAQGMYTSFAFSNFSLGAKYPNGVSTRLIRGRSEINPHHSAIVSHINISDVEITISKNVSRTSLNK